MDGWAEDFGLNPILIVDEFLECLSAIPYYKDVVLLSLLGKYRNATGKWWHLFLQENNHVAF